MGKILILVCATLVCTGCFTSSISGGGRLWNAYTREHEVEIGGESGLRILAVENVGVARFLRDMLGSGVSSDEQLMKTAKFSMSSTDASGRGGLEDIVFGMGSGLTMTAAGENTSQAARTGDFVPAELRASKFLKEYAEIVRGVQTDDVSTTDVSLKRGDLVEFARSALRVASDSSEAEKTTIGRILRLYLGAYLQGKYVDRAGRQLSKPSVVDFTGESPKVKVGNDTIAGFAIVAIEAMGDAVFETPVYFKESGGAKIYFNASGKEPSVATFFPNKFRRAVSTTPENPGVTELEAQLIQRVSAVAAIHSRTISAIVFGLVKEAKISFVVGADLAIGDHETLKVLIETIFEVASRRLTESASEKALRRFGYTVDPRTERIVPKKDSGLNRLVALLLSEQHLLDKALNR